MKNKFGPGILFAASAVGVSHLVQSTRAGAEYGFTLAVLIALACLLKYPAFRFGSDYASQTGTSLLDAYERQGVAALLLVALLLPIDMFFATAAVTLVTAGIAKSVFHFQLGIVTTAVLLLVGCGVFLLTGRYKAFESLTKFFVLLLTLLTIVSAAMVTTAFQSVTTDLTPAITFDQSTILFLLAVAGWMPTGITVSVYQSIWVCAKAKTLDKPLSRKEVGFDFNFGYLLTFFLALCFLLLGAAVLYTAGIPVNEGATKFAAQLIEIFTGSIGEWAYPIIAAAALATMLSTLLTVLDGPPRSYAHLFIQLLENLNLACKASERKLYLIILPIQIAGASMMLILFLQSFKTFIDFATGIAFLSAPVIAYFNHKAMFSEQIKNQPGPILRLWSQFGIFAMTILALIFSYYRFIS